ncbi:MAG: M3 family oligoendopeptidase [Oscillospiraceae bacterium]|nr:M3 family oligoendopeptidase [Oscillospiraceae bacterium]
MKFKDYIYKRTDEKAALAKLDELLTRAGNAKSAEEQIAVGEELAALQNDTATMASLAYTRNSLDMSDSFYKEEQGFYDNFIPLCEEKSMRISKVFINSPFRPDLENTWGAKAFEEMEMSVKSISEEIVGLMGEEAELAHKYDELCASAQIEFMGETLNIEQLGKYKVDPDASVRRAACEAMAGFYNSHLDELDEIYQSLVKNRNTQAKTLGFKNYTQLSYLRLSRNGYGPEEVRQFRENVAKDLVPLVAKIKAAQAKRIGLDKIRFSDDNYMFADGNPAPKGSPEHLLAQAVRMYSEMSPQTKEFIEFMNERDLFDLVARKNKATGGYCTEFPNYKSPFIFSNFRGTAGDVDVLTHEAGHAFNSYSNRERLSFMAGKYSMEIAETHSMSMEFFTEPWYHLFFQEDTEKYILQHFEDAVSFIPYGCIVDEFQHFVYDRPESTIEDQNKKWMELEAKFRPYLDYDALPFFGEGRTWQRQSHIYTVPFYYIDYCLSQTIALQFYMLMSENRANAWEKYMYFIKNSCKRKFTDLMEDTGMDSPFTDGSLKTLGKFVEKWLKNHA